MDAEIDETKLSLAISNLVENGIKYNVDDGWVRVTLDADHKYFYVKVADSGMGIPEESIGRIFERFYRTDASRNSATGGSGIGLSIVKKIIEDHGGKIWATSKESIGTVMYFVIRKYQEVPNEQSINS